MEAILEMPAPVTEPRAVKSGKKKILLVDDDFAIRQILQHLLSDENYLVLTAANGVEALELVNATKPDLLLLDLNMPIKGGWETIEQLSAKNPMLPIILITAQHNQLFPALASGVSALMEKPLDLVKLLQTIENLLSESDEARQARRMGWATKFHYYPPRNDEPSEPERHVH
jgi:CheY-like chemotaxis protein